MGYLCSIMVIGYCCGREGAVVVLPVVSLDGLREAKVMVSAVSIEERNWNDDQEAEDKKVPGKRSQGNA